MTDLRVALFVEGSEGPPAVRGERPLERIWNERLGKTLRLCRFDPVIPISKKNLVALDPRNPPMSGAAEALDKLIARKLKQSSFDAALVAWDLVPAWNPADDFCRWRETVDLYRLLAQSDHLQELWREQAARRHRELTTRKTAGARTRPPTLEPGMLIAVCMEPMFESLLVQDEAAVKKALGLHGKSTPVEWPKGWADPTERRPDDRILAKAINAVRKVRPKLRAVKRVVGDLRTNKDGWGEFLLRSLLADASAKQRLLEHPLLKRLAAVAAK